MAVKTHMGALLVDPTPAIERDPLRLQVQGEVFRSVVYAQTPGQCQNIGRLTTPERSSHAGTATAGTVYTCSYSRRPGPKNCSTPDPMSCPSITSSPFGTISAVRRRVPPHPLHLSTPPCRSSRSTKSLRGVAATYGRSMTIGWDIHSLDRPAHRSSVPPVGTVVIDSSSRATRSTPTTVRQPQPSGMLPTPRSIRGTDEQVARS